MKNQTSDNLFQVSSALKILSHLIDHTGQDVLPGEVLKATSLSRVGIYLALKQLLKQKLITKQQRGRFGTYTVAHSNPVVKQFKIMSNIILLMPVIERLQPHVKKAVLFGSASRGEDYPDSDLDLFLLSQDPDGAARILSKTKFKRKLQTIIKTPSDYAEFTEKNRTFNQEIERGVVLWEEKK